MFEVAAPVNSHAFSVESCVTPTAVTVTPEPL
jgi:hypothetical protein